MAQRKFDGTYTPDTVDHMRKAVEDAIRARGSSPPAGITAAQTAAYNEAFTWGSWFKLQLNRNAI